MTFHNKNFNAPLETKQTTLEEKLNTRKFHLQVYGSLAERLLH